MRVSSITQVRWFTVKDVPGRVQGNSNYCSCVVVTSSKLYEFLGMDLQKGALLVNTNMDPFGLLGRIRQKGPVWRWCWLLCHLHGWVQPPMPSARGCGGWGLGWWLGLGVFPVETAFWKLEVKPEPCLDISSGLWMIGTIETALISSFLMESALRNQVPRMFDLSFGLGVVVALCCQSNLEVSTLCLAETLPRLLSSSLGLRLCRWMTPSASLQLFRMWGHLRPDITYP